MPTTLWVTRIYSSLYSSFAKLKGESLIYFFFLYLLERDWVYAVPWIETEEKRMLISKTYPSIFHSRGLQIENTTWLGEFRIFTLPNSNWRTQKKNKNCLGNQWRNWENSETKSWRKILLGWCVNWPAAIHPRRYQWSQFQLPPLVPSLFSVLYNINISKQ